MIKENFKFIIILFSLTLVTATNAQTGIKGDSISVNTITTAVPFLRINPDARAGALGYASIATSPDANGIFANAAKMAFIEYKQKDGSIDKNGNNFGVSLTFIPWLRGIANDVYMADLAGYYNLRNKKNKDIQQSISASLRFFSLGSITFTNDIGTETGQGNPQELAFDINYARKLSKKFGVALGLRYIYSNLGTGVAGSNMSPGNAVAADLSMFYTTPIKVKKVLKGMDFNFGLALTNIGSKMSYTKNGNESDKDFLPANMGLGFGLEMDIDDFNEINVYFDINKLLVPSPDTTDANHDLIPDYKTKSQISGIFTSFGDAPGGFSEEMAEFNIGGGIEYVYNNTFMARLGYFYEAPSKGARKFLSAGAGIKYSVFTLNAAYIIPTSKQVGPLDNTMYFSLLFNFNSGGKKQTVSEVQ
tara:strand:- start:4225 stop:5478 length:1254 start_codon:yes stop_codon:yes gene_type:complete